MTSHLHKAQNVGACHILYAASGTFGQKDASLAPLSGYAHTFERSQMPQY